MHPPSPNPNQVDIANIEAGFGAVDPVSIAEAEAAAALTRTRTLTLTPTLALAPTLIRRPPHSPEPEP